MLGFWKQNVNPKGRKTGDCSTRALVGVLNISYEEAIRCQAEAAIKRGYGLTCKQTIDAIMQDHGYVKMKQPRKPDGSKYTVGEMDELLSPVDLEEGVLISVSGHWTCTAGYNIQDTWDCRDYTVCNYWVKANTLA